MLTEIEKRLLADALAAHVAGKDPILQELAASINEKVNAVKQKQRKPRKKAD